MFSIENNLDNTIIIKKSKFITKLYKINNINEINNILYNLKKEYKDATHVCYAYILNEIEKCSDDGEPNKTAGLPILNVLKKNQLNYILAVVIRYFGGIKLGAGGLVRAYSNSIVESLNLAKKRIISKGLNITIIFKYDNIKKIDNIIKNAIVVNKIFGNNITYIIEISKEEFEHAKSALETICQTIIINHDTIIAK